MFNVTSESGFIKTWFFDSEYPQPKKIVLELSDCGTFYNACLYTDFMATSGETYEGYIKTKMTMRSFVDRFDFVVPDNKEDVVFTITIPEEN